MPACLQHWKTGLNMSEVEKMIEPTAASAPAANISRLAAIALGVAVLAVLLLGWLWLDAQQYKAALELQLSQKLGEFDTKNRESALLAKKAEESTTQANARMAVLEQKLAESQSQQESLQTLYQEFANHREERVMTEVEQLLIIANEQLQLASNLKTALLAMQTADTRLQQLDKPQAIQLRKLLTKDIQRLQISPSVDTVGISLRLETMAAEVNKLPLVSEHHPRASDTPIAPEYQSSRWKSLAHEIWQDLRRLIRIERIDHPEPPLLTPEQAFFLRENLRLHLLTARIALLQRDEATYHADLASAENWLQRHFDTSTPAVQAAITTAHQLAGNAINIQLPDISESLNGASKYKIFLQKGER